MRMIVLQISQLPLRHSRKSLNEVFFLNSSLNSLTLHSFMMFLLESNHETFQGPPELLPLLLLTAEIRLSGLTSWGFGVAEFPFLSRDVFPAGFVYSPQVRFVTLHLKHHDDDKDDHDGDDDEKWGNKAPYQGKCSFRRSFPFWSATRQNNFSCINDDKFRGCNCGNHHDPLRPSVSFGNSMQSV